MLKSITEQDSAEDILKNLLKTLSDPTLVRTALDLLIANSQGKIQQTAEAAKALFNRAFSSEFFQTKMSELKQIFSANNIPLPAQLNAENLAKVFSELLAKRFLNIRELLKLLGLPAGDLNSLRAILSLYRDAIRKLLSRSSSKDLSQALDAIESALEQAM